MAGRVSALSRNLCGMVGASSVVAGTVGALVVRVGALSRKFCVMMGASYAQAGAISVVLGLV